MIIRDTGGLLYSQSSCPVISHVYTLGNLYLGTFDLINMKLFQTCWDESFHCTLFLTFLTFHPFSDRNGPMPCGGVLSRALQATYLIVPCCVEALKTGCVKPLPFSTSGLAFLQSEWGLPCWDHFTSYNLHYIEELSPLCKLPVSLWPLNIISSLLLLLSLLVVVGIISRFECPLLEIFCLISRHGYTP